MTLPERWSRAMMKSLQIAKGEQVKSHEELRNVRDIFIAVDVYRTEFSTHFPATIQRCV